jgi:hypothetical protein
MMTETEDASLVFDLEAVLRADGEVFAKWPLPQINSLDDVSTLESDTIGGNWMRTPKKSYTRVASTNQDIDQVPPKNQAPSKGDSRDGRTTKRIYIMCILLGPVLIAVICGLAIVLARLRQEEVESSQSASRWDMLPKPAPVPPTIDGGDDSPLPSPSTFPLAEPTRLPEEPATTTPAYPTNGFLSSSAPIPTDIPGGPTDAPLFPSPSPELQEEFESSQSASWGDVLPNPAPVPPPIDGGDDAPLPSPSRFPLAEPMRLPEEPATTTLTSKKTSEKTSKKTSKKKSKKKKDKAEH